MKKILILLFAALALFTSCEKKKTEKTTRSGPTVSLKYNGTYYESFSTNLKFEKFQTLTGTGYQKGYMFLPPCADYFIQNRIWCDTLCGAETFTGASIETMMLWYQGTNYFAWNSFTLKLDSVVSNKCYGTFSGYLVKLQSTDTIFITAGKYNGIPIVN